MDTVEPCSEVSGHYGSQTGRRVTCLDMCTRSAAYEVQDTSVQTQTQEDLVKMLCIMEMID